MPHLRAAKPSPQRPSLFPKSRKGKVTATICADCHRAIHASFTNKELEREYSTVEALLAHEGFLKVVRFIAKQDPGGRVRTARTRDHGRRRGGT